MRQAMAGAFTQLVHAGEVRFVSSTPCLCVPCVLLRPFQPPDL